MFNKRFIILFYTRLALYLIAIGLPVFHPAVVVSYDASSVWLWFLFIPLQMHIAYFLSPPKIKMGIWLGSSLLAIFLSILIIPGFGPEALLFLAAQIVAFIATVIVFKAGAFGRPFAVVEMLFLGFLYVRMLGFSRASETFAQASSAITQIILGVCLGALLLHSIVLYLSTFKEGVRRKTIREVVIFLTAAAAIGVAAALLMPPDFVNHSVVLNYLNNPPNPELIPLDEYTDGMEGGNLRSNRSLDDEGRNQGSEGNGEQGSEGESEDDGQSGGRLQGIAADQWDSQGGGSNQGQSDGQGEPGEGQGEGESRQYAVMVIASEVEPVYAADAYFGAFDADQGFTFSRDEPFNELTYLRLLETWNNDSPAIDRRREPVEVFTLSTIPERVVAYEPLSIQPTILNNIYHPFDYSYTSVSGMSLSEPRDWQQIRDLTEREKLALRPFLDIPLREDIKAPVTEYAEQIFGESTNYFERLSSILENFSTYQYQIGFTDDVSVDHIYSFLFDTQNGDCTEFSNSAAILARLAGIPSRVVTGYLASSGLQTPTHFRGILELQSKIEALQQFSAEDLYLVTNVHRHSWMQVYMPDLGWIDIETTSTAIPPPGGMNPNEMDVVIPILQIEPAPKPGFVFPWRLALQALGILLAAGLAGAYAFRYTRLLVLSYVARGQSLKSLKALYSILLSRLAAEGYAIKPDSETSKEYAENLPEIRSFADMYTKLRYKERFGPGEQEGDWIELRTAYETIVTQTKRKGVVGFIKRIFSLRDLSY